MTRSTTHDGANFATVAGNGQDDHEDQGRSRANQSRTGSGSLDTGGDSFAGDLDPILAVMSDEFSRRALAGETVDVDQLVSAHPEQAEAFRKIAPILRGSPRCIRLRAATAPRPTSANPGQSKEGSSPTFRSSAKSAAAAWGSCMRRVRLRWGVGSR